MSVTLVLPKSLADEWIATASETVETAGVLLASIVTVGKGTIRILGRRMQWVPDEAYQRRDSHGLSIGSEGYIHALGQAERLKATPLWVHTHPSAVGIPIPSQHDEIVDQQLQDLFRLRSGSSAYGSIVISPSKAGISFTGRLDLGDGQLHKIDRMWIVGDRLSLTHSFQSHTSSPSPDFDRNIRAFGEGIQRALGNLTIGIVGCGGTGSAVAEQLVRLGVRRFRLVDPDELSRSNVTRVYGSSASDVGQPKVDVLKANITRIADDSQVEVLRSMVTLQSAARELISCDVLFGCTDDNAGRLVLSRMATYFLVPTIDCGVLLTSGTGGTLAGIDGRVTIMSPGEACLVCRGRIDISRAAAELMTPQERAKREDEGYAPALGRVEPAVITFTSMVASAAVNELLERMIGYGPQPRPSEVLLRYHEREISTNIALPREGHYCHAGSGKLGIGVTDPFLEQVWPG